MRCGECSGSGACDPCDGYGTFPESWPDTGDGGECTICSGSGVCPECYGDGTPPDEYRQETSGTETDEEVRDDHAHSQ